MMPAHAFVDPNTLTRQGKEIYALKYQAEFEANHKGKFVAINLRTEAATLAATAEDALLEARAADPQALFHLIRVGLAAAFRR